MKRKLSTKRVSSKATWSTLLKELLESILERLDLADQIRFSSVCKWWRFAADNPAIKKHFNLIPSDDPAHLIDTLLSTYWMSWTWAVFVGGFEGWLVLQMDHSKLFLLKPGLPLISLPPLPHVRNGDFAMKVVISSEPDSSSDCSIVVWDVMGMWFCRLGDTVWTQFWKDQNPFVVEDITLYKNLVYAIHRVGGQDRLAVFDSSLNPSKTSLKFESIGRSKTHLVVASDKLLMVATNLLCSASPLVELFEINVNNMSYTRLEGIGDNIVLLTPRASIFLSATYYQGFFPPNHIYGLWNRLIDEEKGLVLYSFHDQTTRIVGTKRNGGYHFDACVNGKTNNGCPIFFTLFRLRS